MSRVDDLSAGDRERYLGGAWRENAARRALGQARDRCPGERAHPSAPRYRYCYTFAQSAWEATSRASACPPAAPSVRPSSVACPRSAAESWQPVSTVFRMQTQTALCSV